MKLILQKGQKLYFTSDTHYNHSNLCSATTQWENSRDKTRKFPSLDMMNTTIVNNINEVVGQDDILFHLGDWSFGGFERIEEFRNRINCKNIHLVLGNHDHHIQKNRDDIQSIFQSVHQYIPSLGVRRQSITQPEKMDKYSFVLFHFPIASWDGMGDGVIHLHGHTHLPPHQRLNGRGIDVGMDGNGLYPISMDEVLRIMKGRPIETLVLPSDHHQP
jgi:calcineurin-like phosphoesterase family protein